MATKKECVERAMRELFIDVNHVKRIVDRAERMNFRGFEEQVKDGKRLFVMDLEGA
jgi:hypothetical protein